MKWINADAFLRAPMARWQHLYERLERRAAESLEGTLTSTACVSSRAAVYVRARLNGADHDFAVKLQNKVARQVRRALGFTYPDDPLTF